MMLESSRNLNEVKRVARTASNHQYPESPPAQTPLAEDSSGRSGEPESGAEADRGLESSHRLPGSALSEHLRVLVRSNGDVHAGWWHLHAALRLLRGRKRRTGRARCPGASARC